MSRNHRESEFKPRHLLWILCAVCVFLIIVSSFSSSVNNVLRSATGMLLMPLQSGLNKAGSYWSGELDELLHLRGVQKENEMLKDELAHLREENARLKLRTDELSSLQELLALKDQYPQYETVGAHIIGKNSGNWFKTFLIDKGTSDGLSVNMNVVADGGLVGIVTSVGDTYATVSTIIDDGRFVAGMSAGTLDFCMVRGDLTLYETGRLLLDSIDKDAGVNDGDMIVTSNTSALYMPGILIGYAGEITTDANNLTKSGILIPVVDFSRLNNVLVVTELKETGD